MPVRVITLFTEEKIYHYDRHQRLANVSVVYFVRALLAGMNGQLAVNGLWYGFLRPDERTHSRLPGLFGQIIAPGRYSTAGKTHLLGQLRHGPVQQSYPPMDNRLREACVSVQQLITGRQQF